jgi:hypothetical protein
MLPKDDSSQHTTAIRREAASDQQSCPTAAEKEALMDMEGFLSRFRPSRRLIRQIENDVRGVSRDRMPNVILGSSHAPIDPSTQNCKPSTATAGASTSSPAIKR